MTTTEARRTAVFARATTRTLFQTIETLDALPRLASEQALARGWAIEEIERRHPEVDDAMNRWAENDEPSDSYVATLKQAVAALGVEV